MYWTCILSLSKNATTNVSWPKVLCMCRLVLVVIELQPLPHLAHSPTNASATCIQRIFRLPPGVEKEHILVQIWPQLLSPKLRSWCQTLACGSHCGMNTMDPQLFARVHFYCIVPVEQSVYSGHRSNQQWSLGPLFVTIVFLKQLSDSPWLGKKYSDLGYQEKLTLALRVESQFRVSLHLHLW